VRITRRELLITAAAFVALPGRSIAGSGARSTISWPEFQSDMLALAKDKRDGSINQQTVAESGLLHLKQLDIDSADFKQSVDASYESGNRYWLWQRLIKQQNINGGILNIHGDHLVPLHDHPGATGMLRIISGETEVWQFDEVKAGKGKRENVKGSRSENAAEQDSVELVRFKHRVLRPGDTALLTPEEGNIHALRAASRQCSMLDFFIPPYVRSQRSWYEPLVNNWFDKEKITCRKISQDEFLLAQL
jgi:hypothetical protein